MSRKSQEQRCARVVDKLDTLGADGLAYAPVVLEVLSAVGATSDFESALLSEVAARQPWMLNHAAAESPARS